MTTNDPYKKASAAEIVTIVHELSRKLRDGEIRIVDDQKGGIFVYKDLIVEIDLEVRIKSTR